MATPKSNEKPHAKRRADGPVRVLAALVLAAGCGGGALELPPLDRVGRMEVIRTSGPRAPEQIHDYREADRIGRLLDFIDSEERGAGEATKKFPPPEYTVTLHAHNDQPLLVVRIGADWFAATDLGHALSGGWIYPLSAEERYRLLLIAGVG